MASHVEMGCDLCELGDEWAPRKHTQAIIHEFIHPYIDKTSVVAEIGVGGGGMRIDL